MKKISDVFLGILLLAFLTILLHYLLNFKVAVETWMTTTSQLEWRNRVIAGSGLISLFLIGSFFFKSEIRSNISLVLISSYCTLFVCNLILGLKAVRSEIGYDWLDPEGIKSDKFNKLKFIHNLRGQGVDAYPFGRPSLIWEHLLNKKNLDPNIVFPLAGISNVVSVACNETGEWLVFESDRYGFNNEDNSYNDIPLDVMLIGDSFAFGSCVIQTENLAGQLKKRGNSVISGGITGSGPLGELAVLKEYGPQLKPKSVFWLYFNGNDLRDLLYEMQVPILMQYLNKGFSQNLVTKQKEIDQMWKDVIKVLENKHIFGKLDKESYFSKEKLKDILILMNLRRLLGLHPKTFYDSDLEAESSTLKLFKTILMEAKAESLKWGGELYFVFLPSRASQDQPFSHRNYANILELVKELNIPIVDFKQHLHAKEDPLSFYPLRNKLYHYNVKGYNLLAELISTEALKNR